MKEVIFLFLVNQLLIVGWWKSFQEGMIFGDLGTWAWKHFPHAACKPLYQCMPCMSSLYGASFFFLSPVLNQHPIYVLPWVLCLCGSGAIIQHFFDLGTE